MCFLDKAKQVIKDKQQWASGESVTLWSKGAMQVWVKNESGFLTMQFFIDNKKLTQRYYSKPLTVGYLHPEQGCVELERAGGPQVRPVPRPGGARLRGRLPHRGHSFCDRR